VETHVQRRVPKEQIATFRKYPEFCILFYFIFYNLLHVRFIMFLLQKSHLILSQCSAQPFITFHTNTTSPGSLSSSPSPVPTTPIEDIDTQLEVVGGEDNSTSWIPDSENRLMFDHLKGISHLSSPTPPPLSSPSFKY
jgi:hypothetical protein